MRAAIIDNDVVTNIIVISDGYTGNAVYIGGLSVAIGDTYDGEHFYRDGELVTIPKVTIDEYAEALQILGVEL